MFGLLLPVVGALVAIATSSSPPPTFVSIRACHASWTALVPTTLLQSFPNVA